uniref:Uncharacterized protein n=1 Tax=Oryza meridionalis TaxID=40149 RepID=A0A0E0ECW0_9ORYZ
MSPEMRFTPPLLASLRIAGFVIPWMLSRSTFRWRFAPPLPSPFPPFPRPDIFAATATATATKTEWGIFLSWEGSGQPSDRGAIRVSGAGGQRLPLDRGAIRV